MARITISFLECKYSIGTAPRVSQAAKEIRAIQFRIPFSTHSGTHAIRLIMAAEDRTTLLA